MSISGPAIATALNAMRLYTRQVDRAAEQIAAAGLTDVTTDSASEPEPTAAPGGPAADGTDLSGAMVNMLIAQRAFSAQLRVLRTADEMLRDTVEQTRARQTPRG
jgi:Flagellar basal body rod FlgEFG protein C-terminal